MVQEKEQKEFTGNIGEAIQALLEMDTDCCEITHTAGDLAITVAMQIVRVAHKGEVVYEAPGYNFEEKEISVEEANEENVQLKLDLEENTEEYLS